MLESIFPEEIYINHISYIKEIKFTPREIEIIACIIHGKSLKGIAIFLSTEDKIIGERSIETHILNIRRKIGCNSKEGIVDFIEKSDEYQIIRYYYSILLIRKEFNKVLKEITSIVNFQEITFLILFKSNTYNPDGFIKHLMTDLLVVTPNVKLHDICELDSVDSLQYYNKKKNNFIIYIAAQNIKDNTEEKIETELTKAGLDNLILFNYEASDFLQAIAYINDDKNYYNLFFSLINRASSNKINIIIEKFKEKYQKLLPDSLYNPNFVNNKNLFLRIYQKYSLLVTSIIIILIGLVIFLFINSTTSTVSQRIDLTAEEISLIQGLTSHHEGLSLNNLEREQSDKNFLLIKRMDEVTSQIGLSKIGHYFARNLTSSSELINYLYNFNAMSSYYMFCHHDAIKSQKLLLLAKNVAEQFLIGRSKVVLNFDKLTPEEIHTELLPIKNLPEMYATTIYFLGRSALLNKEREVARKHFRLSQYLSSKLQMFEAILSLRNGLILIFNDEIEDIIKTKNYSLAKEKINESIKMLEELQNNQKKYFINFQPGSVKQEYIIPANDIYHIIDCSKRTTKLYRKLILITNDHVERKKYIEKAVSYYLNHLNFSKLITSKTPRIAANFYNELGELTLIIYDDNQFDFLKFKNKLITELNLNDGNDLEVIFQIFNVAKTLSRNTEFTKADAYNGMAKVLEKMSKNCVDQSERDKLIKQIQYFKSTATEINQALNR